MEEKKMSIKMKKTIATLLVTVGLAVATFCGVGLLSLAINTDALDVDVEDWLQDKEYRESDTLAWHMTSDMYSVVRYMGLQQMLEDNGTLNMERPALVAQYPDGSIVTYTMADLVAMGEENGIYVYDEAREMAGDVSYYITAPASGEMEDTRVRVLWSLTEKEDAAVDLGTDAWKIRQERIDEAIAYAKTAGVPTSVADGLIPDESVWDQLTTKELLELCQNLAARYPGTQAIEPQLLSLWSQELSDLQATEQDILNQIPAVEEATTEVATEPTQETTQSPDDEEALDETAPVEMPEQELDSMWSEELETVRRWENNLRDEMYEILQDRRGSQQTSWCPLYEELHVFLKSYLQEYYYLRRTMEEPGNLNYRIVLTQGDQTEIYTDVYTAENNGQLMGMENWDVSYSYDSTTRRIETTLPNSMREDPIQDLQTWSRYHYDSATITFGIDVDALLYEDSYQSEASSYVHYRNRVFLMVGTMAFCALLALVGMIWLMPLCGRRDGVEEIHLNLYDRLPTELGAFGIFLLFMGGCLVLVGARDFSYWIMYNTVAADVRDWMMTGIAAALLVLIYLILWLGLYGLIRRIKAHTFWKNSLCAIVLRWCLKPLGWCMSGLRWCGDKMKAGWMALVDNGDVTWKTAAVFIGYLLINFLLFLSYMNHYDGFFFLLMLAFNALVGVHLIIKSAERKRIRQGVTKIAAGHLDHHLPLQNLTGEEKKLAEQINRISGGLKTAVEDSLKNERMKTELITNVSHDIKTPLTSIINYVDLLKREKIEDPKIQGYIDVLDQKSQRLKTLTEDLVEASKASSGTLKLSMEKIDFVELINQTNGEFTDRFAACNLSVVSSIPEEPAYIMADGRYVWRILENLYRNAEKYSMPGTRVYIEVFEKIGRVFFVMKNVSNAPLNIKAEALTERFIRGDVSRTTEGSGLGLSIAKDMTELMNGTFRIYLDGDLFRVTVSFAVIPEQKTDLKEMEENIRRRVAEEEKKVQVETADVVAESGFAKGAETNQKERKLPKLSLPKIPFPKKKKEEESVEEDDFFQV